MPRSASPQPRESRSRRWPPPRRFLVGRETRCRAIGCVDEMAAEEEDAAIAGRAAMSDRLRDSVAHPERMNSAAYRRVRGGAVGDGDHRGAGATSAASAAIDLAVHVERQGVEQADAHRHLVFSQALGGERAQGVDATVAPGWSCERDRTWPSCASGRRRRRRRRWQDAGEHRLDLAGRDVGGAADDDLLAPADEPVPAVGVAPRQIPVTNHPPRSASAVAPDCSSTRSPSRRCAPALRPHPHRGRRRRRAAA